MRIACIVGARPNFMKIAPILRAMKSHDRLQPVLIHTGQHYDKNLSDIFFEELGIARPDISLGVGSGSHARQTADVLVAVEQVLVEARDNGRPFASNAPAGLRSSGTMTHTTRPSTSCWRGSRTAPSPSTS